MKIYELLDRPEKWTKYCCARDITGNVCKSKDPTAVSWCLLGAVVKCYPSILMYDQVVKSIYLKSTLREKFPHTDYGFEYDCIARFNDDVNTTFDDVIRICKELDV